MRIPKMTQLLALLALGLFVSVLAMAGPKVNPRKGKVYFKKNCRVCHDGSVADVKTLTPMTKTIAQWTRDFAEEGDAVKCLPRVKEKLDAELSEQDMLDIQSYLVYHAADSDQPATCGN